MSSCKLNSIWRCDRTPPSSRVFAGTVLVGIGAFGCGLREKTERFRWNNISWDILNSTAAAVKSSCPEPFIYYNEGGAPLWGNVRDCPPSDSSVATVFNTRPLQQYNVNHMHTEYPSIPPAVDFVSTDDYDSINTGGYNSSQIKRLSNAIYQYPRT